MWPLLFLAALSHAASMAWPFHFGFESGQALWALQLLSMLGLGFALQKAHSARHAFALGQGFATVALSATFWWLFVAMHTYGGLPAVLAVLAVVTLAAALGLYYALACALWWRLAQKNPRKAALAFAAVWTLAELARGTWLTGFGWGAGGYAHVQGPLAFYIPWLGVYGVGALAAWTGMALAQGKNGPRWQWAALAVLVLVSVAMPQGPERFSRSHGALTVTVLQGNIAQNEKFEARTGIVQSLEWYRQTLLNAKTQLVVAPETAIPVLPQQLPAQYWNDLRAHFQRNGQAALVGIPLGDNRLGYTNSVVGFLPESPKVLRYDKHHLVPFGEFIPPLFRWFTDLMHIPLGDFNRGAVAQAPFAFANQRLAPHICYEDLFGEELAQRFTEPTASPTVFVNLSNIGWFGDTVAIDQHLNIARMRAMEFERPFVRATNTGATVVIDHHGQVTHAAPRLTQAVLVGEVNGREGLTPYAWWASRFGLWPLWLICIALAVFSFAPFLPAGPVGRQK
jgi:apolipoprotein N-acyltransferase